MKMKREITFTLTVLVPAAVGENEVETAINAALDEENGVDWESWFVGRAVITDVRKFKE
jgi:hypothetical protein